jgi:hypothetical protein
VFRRAAARAVGEVVLVPETLTETASQGGQVYLERIIAEANAAKVAEAVLATVDDEAVEVLVAPARSDLRRGMRLSNGAVVHLASSSVLTSCAFCRSR